MSAEFGPNEHPTAESTKESIQAAVDELDAMRQGKYNIPLEKQELADAMRVAKETGANIEEMICEELASFYDIVNTEDLYLGDDSPEIYAMKARRVLKIIEKMRQGMDWINVLPPIKDETVLEITTGPDLAYYPEQLVELAHDHDQKEVLRRIVRNIGLRTMDKGLVQRQETITLNLPVALVERICQGCVETRTDLESYIGNNVDIGRRFILLAEQALQPQLKDIEGMTQRNGRIKY